MAFTWSDKLVAGGAILARAQGNDFEPEWTHFKALALARLLVASGDTARARVAYQDFLTRWKQADADVPLLKQAQAEAAKLR